MSQQATSTLILLACLATAGWMQAQTGSGMSAGAAASAGSSLGLQPLGANTLVLGSETSFSYDNNALNTNPGTQNFITALYPHVGLNIERQRWQSTVTYIPGFSYSTANIASYNLISQAFGATFSYRATKRLTLNIRDSFSSSTNPFDSLRNSTALPQFGTLNTSTPVSWNLIPKTIENAEVEADYQFSRRTSGYIRGGYQYLDYQQLSSSSRGISLSQQSNSGLFTAGLTRQLNTHSETGLQLSSQILDYSPGGIRTNAQSLSYFLQTSITPKIAISAIIGPQYISTSETGLIGGLGGLAVPSRQSTTWSWMGGGTVSWTGSRNGVMASLIRQIGAGTGLQGNVSQTIASFQAQHKMGKRSAVSAFASYNINNPLVPSRTGLGAGNNYLSMGGQFTRELNDRFVFGFTGWAVRQGGGASANPYYSGNHNRAAFTLSYQLTRPLRSR